MTKSTQKLSVRMLTALEIEELKKDMEKASKWIEAELARQKAEGIPILKQERNKKTNE